MGIITITFDDGYKDTFNNCSEFLYKNNIKATFAIPTAFIGKTLENRPIVNTGDIIQLENYGHEINAHTKNHKNLLDIFNSSGEKEVRAEMTESKKELEQILGAEKIKSMVFPFIEANNNPLLRKISGEYYSSNRITSEKIVFNKLPVTDPFSITGFAVTTAITIPQLNELSSIAKNHNFWFIEVFHLVCEKNTLSASRPEPYKFFTHIDDFKKHISYLKSNDIQVLTQTEAIKKYGL
ncbi:Polysaccharide deacetylase domain protein [Candidatus Omnitrophus magneticus]|uniref:Polysaccharide deacetylase domain protein n=1 Tax=Candidatus Omnitrophus magneticus TaxID=1609969 RepID=A0A0F0CRY5_9BACT|nr:Polysaccharide deacetylase domain protein [Candidatus Omnitrophus magneticus]